MYQDGNLSVKDTKRAHVHVYQDGNISVKDTKRAHVHVYQDRNLSVKELLPSGLSFDNNWNYISCSIKKHQLITLVCTLKSGFSHISVKATEFCPAFVN